MTATRSAPHCPACSALAPEDARFCPRCGFSLPAAATETLELPGATRFAPRFHEVRRQPLGLEPVALLAGLQTAALIATVVLFAVGAWAVGVALLAITLAMLALFVAGARRQPEAPLSRLMLNGADRVGSFLRRIAVSGRAWMRAAVRLLRVRQRRQRLRHELHRQLEPLGEAVYRGDDQRARALKAQARRIERALAETDHERAALLEDMHEQLADERAAVQATAPLPAQAPRART